MLVLVLNDEIGNPSTRRKPSGRDKIDVQSQKLELRLRPMHDLSLLVRLNNTEYLETLNSMFMLSHSKFIHSI